MTHPLTDEQLEALEIARIEHPLNDLRIYDEIISLELSRPNDDMRAAYDRGFEDAIEFIGRMGLAPRRALAEAQEYFYNKENNS